MSAQAKSSAAVRAAGIIGPLGFALGVVAAVNSAAADRLIAAALSSVLTVAAFALMAWAIRRRALDGRTRLTTPERAKVRFQILQGVWVSAFVLSLVFGAPFADELEGGPLRLAVLGAPVLFLAILIGEFVRMIVRSDERERAQHVTACAVAGGALVVITALWSVLQIGAPGLPGLPGWALLPAFAVGYALVLMRLRDTPS